MDWLPHVLMLSGGTMIAADCLANTGVVSAVGVGLLWLGSWLRDPKLLLVTGPPGALILVMQVWGLVGRRRAGSAEGGPADASQLRGEEGVVVSSDPLRVEVRGEVWDAVSEADLGEGDRVVVRRGLGSRLEVEPAEPSREGVKER